MSRTLLKPNGREKPCFRNDTWTVYCNEWGGPEYCVYAEESQTKLGSVETTPFEAEEAQKIATLWASSSDMLRAMEKADETLKTILRESKFDKRNPGHLLVTVKELNAIRKALRKEIRIARGEA